MRVRRVGRPASGAPGARPASAGPVRIRFVATSHHRSLGWGNRRKHQGQRRGRPVLNARTGILRGAGLAPRRSAADRRSVLMPAARLLFFRSHGFGNGADLAESAGSPVPSC